jgi:methyl-accepting chemotaxis protein
MLNRWTVKTKIYALLAASAGCSLLAIFYLTGSTAALRQQDEELASGLALTDQARVVQLNFKKQVQALKDTLLRGCDLALRDKYQSEFSEFESQVQQGAHDLDAKASSPEVSALLRQFSSAHAQLGVDYRAALRPFLTIKGTSFHKAAKEIVGKDEPAGGLLDKIVAQVSEDEAGARGKNQRLLAQQESSAATTSLLGWLGWLLCGLCGAHFITRRSSRLEREISAHAHELSQGRGDLTKRLPASSKPGAGGLPEAFNSLTETLQQMVARVATSSAQMASASEQIFATTRQSAERCRDQADQADQPANAMRAVSATVVQMAESSQKASVAAQKASDTARRGGQAVQESLSTIRSIADSAQKASDRVSAMGRNSEQIGKIIEVIEGIADQTNLLALNAAIEAARAGEQGRGFAVVADEVRRLAEQTTTATKEIFAMVLAIQEETKRVVEAMELGRRDVATGVDKTAAAEQVLQETIAMADEVGKTISTIVAAAAQQSTANEEIKASLSNMADLGQEDSTGARETAKACADLASLADELKTVVEGFRFDNDIRDVEFEASALADHHRRQHHGQVNHRGVNQAAGGYARR